MNLLLFTGMGDLRFLLEFFFFLFSVESIAFVQESPNIFTSGFFFFPCAHPCIYIPSLFSHQNVQCATISSVTKMYSLQQFLYDQYTSITFIAVFSNGLVTMTWLVRPVSSELKR